MVQKLVLNWNFLTGVQSSEVHWGVWFFWQSGCNVILSQLLMHITGISVHCVLFMEAAVLSFRVLCSYAQCFAVVGKRQAESTCPSGYFFMCETLSMFIYCIVMLELVLMYISIHRIMID